MARRADHTQEELKNLALEKGLEIIDQTGVCTLTARVLAQAMGYAPGTIYHAFGNLDGYLLALSTHILDLWHQDLARKIKASRRPALTTLAEAYIDFAVNSKNRWDLAFAYDFAEDVKRPPSYIAHMAQLLGLIDQSLAKHESDPNKRRRLAKTLWASMHGICALANTQRLSYSAGDTPATLANILLEMIDAKKKS